MQLMIAQMHKHDCKHDWFFDSRSLLEAKCGVEFRHLACRKVGNEVS